MLFTKKKETDNKSDVNIPITTGIVSDFDLLNFVSEFLLSHLTKCSIDLSRYAGTYITSMCRARPDICLNDLHPKSHGKEDISCEGDAGSTSSFRYPFMMPKGSNFGIRQLTLRKDSRDPTIVTDHQIMNIKPYLP